MEGGMDRGLPRVHRVRPRPRRMRSLRPATLLKHPLFVKMHEIAPDPAVAARSIGEQLNLGVSGIVFVKVKSADEVSRAGGDAVRVERRHASR